MDGEWVYLLQGEFFESRQRAGQQTHNERSRSANYVHHSRGQHGDVCVLPCEGIEQGYHCMTTLGQCARDRDREIRVQYLPTAGNTTVVN